MNKNGFTLIEMIAAIIVISMISSIVIITVSNQIEQAKLDAYEKQIELYERKAHEWVLLNGTKGDDFHITLQELVDGNFLTASKLKNPKTQKSFLDSGACIYVEYQEQSKTFVYRFSEDCVK